MIDHPKIPLYCTLPPNVHKFTCTWLLLYLKQIKYLSVICTWLFSFQNWTFCIMCCGLRGWPCGHYKVRLEENNRHVILLYKCNLLTLKNGYTYQIWFGHAHQVWFGWDWFKRSFRGKMLNFFTLVHKSKMAVMKFVSKNMTFTPSWSCPPNLVWLGLVKIVF